MFTHLLSFVKSRVENFERMQSICEKILPDLDNAGNDIILFGLPAYYAGRPSYDFAGGQKNINNLDTN